MMSMGMSASPAIWESYINAVLSNIPATSEYLAITDDLLLHNSKHSHLKYLGDLLKVLFKETFKILPSKCQLFRTELQYMGNTISLKTRKPIPNNQN